jgi:hypothetical protein
LRTQTDERDESFITKAVVSLVTQATTSYVADTALRDVVVLLGGGVRGKQRRDKVHCLVIYFLRYKAFLK